MSSYRKKPGPPRETYTPIDLPTRCLTAQEARLISAYGPPGSSLIQWRDGFVVRIMLATGLRRFEVAALTPEAFTHWGEHRWLKIRGKGKRLRWIPFPEVLYTELLDLRSTVDKQISPLPADVIIPSWSPRTGMHHIASRTIFDSVSRASIKTLQRRISPHILRHTAATLMLSTGGPLQGVQAILGHSSLQTTERYLHQLPESMLRASSAAFYGAIGIRPGVDPYQIDLISPDFKPLSDNHSQVGGAM